MDQLGIDISKKKFDASLLIAGKHRNKVFSNNKGGFGELKKWLKAHNLKSIHVCMEGTGRLWEPLAEFLQEAGMKVSVVNPLKIKGFAQSELRRSKTDVLDAETIARFCRANEPAEWIRPTAKQKAIRDLQRCVQAMKTMRAQEKNRSKSGVLNPRVEREIDEHIKYLSDRIDDLDAEILALLKEDKELKRQFELLNTIKGVGPTTAVTFLGEVCAANFSNARELEVFCGIAPRLRESGSSVRSKSRMSKVGNRRIRGVLYMPALAAMRTNPFLREFAQRLKAAGKPGKVVVGAVMRKLLRLMFAILKSGQPFDPAHISRKPKAA
jgi:transposase